MVLYELATGTHPFAADSTIEMLHAVTARAAPKPTQWLPDMPMTLERLLLRMLEKQDTARPTADEVEAQLTKLAAALSEPAPLRWAGRSELPKRDHNLSPQRADAALSIGWWKWAAGLVVVAVAGGAWSLWRSQPPSETARDDYVQLTNFADSVTSPALSADGKR